MHEDIYDQFIDKVTSVIKKLKVGVPLGKNSNVDMGAVTMKHHVNL